MIDIQQLIDLEYATDTRKKFDFALMNPPYAKNLHLKFLKKTTEIANTIINIILIAFLILNSPLY